MIRRALVTGTLAIATVLGTTSGWAQAAAAPELSTQAVRPGTAFTLTPPNGCPAEAGEQVVSISFTDSEDTTFQLAALTTDSSGSWGRTTLRAPVAGLDETGSWDSAAVAAGLGRVDVTCLDSDYSTADDDPDDPDDPNSEDENATLSYEAVPLTISGAPARVRVTPSLVKPGESITVAPVDVCDTSGKAPLTARLEVSPVVLGSDPDDSDDVDGLGAEADAGAVLSTPLELTDGTWPTTKLKIPDDAAEGDYAVTVDCLDSDQEITSRYQAASLGLGTITAGAPVCTGKGASVRLTGSYPGTLVTGDADELALPTTLRLTGAGPWNVTLDSSLTEGLLLKQKVACPEPDYEMTVSKTGLTSGGAVRARVCNTGDADARALLQVAAKGKKFVTVERQVLKDGVCAWFDGGKVKKGDSAKARVLLDPPGAGSTDLEVEHTFTVRRRD